MKHHDVLVSCAVALLLQTANGRELQQAGDCTQLSNLYNCFVGGVQMASVCINQCTNPHNPLFCQDCEDPRSRCAAAVPNFSIESSTIHMGQGTSTERCPDESPAQMQSLGSAAVATGAWATPAGNACTSLSFQYDCVVGTAHLGQVCVPLCPNSAGSPPCIPCEDVRANCAWAYPGFQAQSFGTYFLSSSTQGCY